MKTIISSLIILLLSTNIASAQFSKADLQAAGLTCSMCSRSVDKQLRTLDFIDSVGINLSSATFTLYFKKGKDVDFNQIKKKVEDAGFSVVLLKPTYKFDNLKIENNTAFNIDKQSFYFLNTSPQLLNGLMSFKIIDRGFVSSKEYKKYEAQLTAVNTLTSNVYHITL